MAAKKKKAAKRVRRRTPRVPPPTLEMRLAMQSYFFKLGLHEERRSAAAERSAAALEVIAQYVADYATRDRVQRMLGAGVWSEPDVEPRGNAVQLKTHGF